MVWFVGRGCQGFVSLASTFYSSIKKEAAAATATRVRPLSKLFIFYGINVEQFLAQPNWLGESKNATAGTPGDLTTDTRNRGAFFFFFLKRRNDRVRGSDEPKRHRRQKKTFRELNLFNSRCVFTVISFLHSTYTQCCRQTKRKENTQTNCYLFPLFVCSDCVELGRKLVCWWTNWISWRYTY